MGTEEGGNLCRLKGRAFIWGHCSTCLRTEPQGAWKGPDQKTAGELMRPGGQREGQREGQVCPCGPREQRAIKDESGSVLSTWRQESGGNFFETLKKKTSLFYF